MFDGRPINRSMSEGWPRPSQAAVSLKKRAVAIICMVMAVLASGLAVAVDTKTGEYELANYLAPIALKRYLKRIIIKDFTRAASENILSLYNYSFPNTYEIPFHHVLRPGGASPRHGQRSL